MALGKATVNIMANLKPLKRGLMQAQSAVSSMVKRAGGLMKTGFTAGFRIISTGLSKITRLAKIAAIALLGIGSASVKIAADSEETANLFDVSMGSMADSANKWVKEYSESLGLFESNTKKSLSTLQLMLTSMGMTEEAAFDMSKGLVEITNDIASLRNLNLDDAFTKVRAGLVGEAEPLRRIGILLNETQIKRMAMTDATIQARLAADRSIPVMKKYGNLTVEVSKKTKLESFELTQLEKVQLRYKALINATTRDQGDFKRTIDSTTNVFRILKEQIQRTGNTIGKVFKKDITNAGKVFRDFLKNNQPMIRGWAKTVKDAIGKVINKLKYYFTLAKRGPEGFGLIFKDLGRIFGDIIKALQAQFAKLIPVAVEIGKAMGEGFSQAIENTKLGKFLTKTGEIAGNLAAPGRALESADLGRLRGIEGRNLNQRIGSITERATGQRVIENRDDIDALNELKAIRKAIELTTGRDLDF